MIQLIAKWVLCGKSAQFAGVPDTLIPDVKKAAADLFHAGADMLFVEDRSEGDREHDQAIELLKEISTAFAGPVFGSGNIRRFEDVKKLLYAGCEAAVIDAGSGTAEEVFSESTARFGAERVGLTDPSGFAIADKHYLISDGVPAALSDSDGQTPVIDGICILSESRPDADLCALREELNAKGLPLGYREGALPFSSFKTNADGLIPAIVQDHRTGEVLMLAWMNEESWNATLRTGKMTYWSRSRKSLWVKGETSGHFQYVKSLSVDCDRDTVLAKVDQVGAACHTGNRSCFYTQVLRNGKEKKNPQEILNDVYGIILDRKEHPKEGSYTNYLFDKGIDKILKKVGEENAEIIIAAKNPDPEEIKYEISDYLYHLMVLMAEKGVTWEEITDELARR